MGHRDAKIVLVTYRFGFFIILTFLTTASSPANALLGSKNKDAEKVGAVIFRDKGCAFCHGVGGIGGKKAPPLTELPKDKSWSPEKITGQILNGGQKMPPFRESLSDDEVAQLVAYLRAKKRPIPPPSTSAPVTVQ